jgi:hypothetical protein
MKKRFKKRLMNSAVWLYTIANAILVSAAAATFLTGNETISYIIVGCEVIVNIFASVNNPDFKGLVKDKDYITDSAEEAVETVTKIYDTLKAAQKKLDDTIAKKAEKK